MNRSELKQIISEAVEEVMKEFSPLGVAEMQLNEKAPPKFPKKLHDKLLKQYKDDKSKAYATMWKLFYAKKKGHKKVNEMWTAFEGAGYLGENKKSNQGVGEQEDHDETDMSNPEENKEVELAKQIKKLASELLSMHGAEEDVSDEEKSDKAD
jgi:hypothetical protein